MSKNPKSKLNCSLAVVLALALVISFGYKISYAQEQSNDLSAEDKDFVTFSNVFDLNPGDRLQHKVVDKNGNIAEIGIQSVKTKRY